MTISKRFVRAFLSCSVFLCGSVAATAQSGLEISQIYGGGGNSAATYTNDFVELYNPTASSISTAGLSVQYGSSTGNFSGVVALTSATVLPGHYFLVQLASGGAVGTALPTADTTGGVNMAAGAGKVALVNVTTLLSAEGATGANCTTLLADSRILDYVGYGAASTCYAGSAAAPGPSNNTTSINRTNLAQNTHSNSTEFALLSPPAPHNSSSTTTPTGTLSGSGAASPNPVLAGNQTTLTITVTPGTSPASSGVAVVGDLRNIGGSQTQSFANPSSDGVTFTYLATVGSNISGAVSLPFTVTDAQSRTASGSLALSVTAQTSTIPIHTIQGSKSTTAQSLSPYAGQQVTTTGVVTTVLSNAFFMQTPDNAADSDATTPEGIEVFTSTKPTVSIGNIVIVSGTVQTYPAVTASKTPASEITSPTVTITNSSNTTLPAPITLTTSMLTPGGGLYQLTPYEGMRVSIPSMTAVSGTDGNLTESSETTVTNGYFYGVITGTARPFREPGIDIRDSFPSQPANVAHFDDNPERIIVTTTLSGGTSIELSTGTVLPNVTGVLDFTYSSDTYYDPSRLILDASYDRTQVSANLVPQAVPTKNSNEFVVASFNIERFFNTSGADNTYAVPQGVSCFSGDASKGTNLCTSEAVNVTQAAYTGRLKKLGLAIENVLLLPDVVTLEEVENQSVASDIAAQINSDTGISGLYTGYSTDNSTYYSQDGTGISVGFLVKNTVDNLGFTQFGQNVSFTPSTGNLTTLNDRPWLVLNAGIKRAAGTKDYPVTVIVNHLKSLINVNSTTSNSTRLKKELQAEAIAGYINTLQANGQHVISGGDFNAFEFSDGYTDTLATYTNGNVLPSDQVVQPGVANKVTPALVNLALTLPANQRWSYQENGSAQILDHMVITQDLQATGVRFAYAHLNADFPISAYSNTNTPARVSDHDAAVGYFVLPSPVLSATLTPISGNFGSVVLNTASSGQQFTLTNTGEAPITVSSVTGSGDFSASSNCTSVAINATCAINVVFTPTATGARTGTLSVVTNTPVGTYTSSLTGTGTGATTQTITFPQPQPGVSGGSATLTATSTSGLVITYSITSGPATVSGSTITYTGPGTVVIAANQAGNATYAAAATVSDTVTVNSVYVWLENATGTADKFSTAGALVVGPAGTAGTAGSLGGAAIDASGSVWLVEQASSALRFVSLDGSTTNSYSGVGGLNAPTSVAVDGVGQVWVSNAGGISQFTNAGAALSPSTGYTGVTVTQSVTATAYSAPAGIAIDLSGNVWVSNSGNNTITEILGAAAPAAPLSTAVTNVTSGVRP